MGISKYLIIIFSIAVFLIPASHANATVDTTEINDEDFVEEYYDDGLFNAEKFRDYYFKEVLRLQNPYHDTFSKVLIYINNDEFKMPHNVDRYDENFQVLKDEQIDLAQKKYLEIMGGKTINNSLPEKHSHIEFVVLSEDGVAILKFREEQKDFVSTAHREDKDFQDYKIQQKIIAKQTFKKMIEEGFWVGDPYVANELWESYNSNSDSRKAKYFEKENVVAVALKMIKDNVISAEELIEDNVISAENLIQDNVISASNLELFWKSYQPKAEKTTQDTQTVTENEDFDLKNLKWKNSRRTTEKFQDLMTEQALLAEQTRDKVLRFELHSNPYNKDAVVEDEIIVADENTKFELYLNRADEKFQEYRLEQIEKAELLLRDFYHLKNWNEYEINNELLMENEFVILEHNNRNDMYFKSLKEIEVDRAEKKLLELLGGKKINN